MNEAEIKIKLFGSFILRNLNDFIEQCRDVIVIDQGFNYIFSGLRDFAELNAE